jgi:hypothetical protein
MKLFKIKKLKKHKSIKLIIIVFVFLCINVTGCKPTPKEPIIVGKDSNDFHEKY